MNLFFHLSSFFTIIRCFYCFHINYPNSSGSKATSLRSVSRIGKTDSEETDQPPLPNSSGDFVINISPCGLHGYHLLGITTFIKQNYNLDKCIFSGASSGAWISLLLTYKGNYADIVHKILQISNQSNNNVRQLGKELQQFILQNYKTEDFDLHKLYIGVMQFDKGIIDPLFGSQPLSTFGAVYLRASVPCSLSKKVIYNNFLTLDDAVNCCIASSYVPFVAGNAFYNYKNIPTIDGGFHSYPYVDNYKPILHLHPHMWYKRKITNLEFLSNKLQLFSDLFFIHKMNFTQIYEKGVSIATINKSFLDTIFLARG
jgi:hypothetical protein